MSDDWKDLNWLANKWPKIPAEYLVEFRAHVDKWIKRDRAERQIGASKSQVRRLQHQMDDDLNARGGKKCKECADYDAEVDEFNAGYEAYENNRTLDDEPTETPWDQWRIGWAWAWFNQNYPPPDDLGEMLERLAEIDPGGKWIPANEMAEYLSEKRKAAIKAVEKQDK